VATGRLGVLLEVLAGRLGTLGTVLAAVVALGGLATAGRLGGAAVMFLGGSRLLDGMTTTV